MIQPRRHSNSSRNVGEWARGMGWEMRRGRVARWIEATKPNSAWWAVGSDPVRWTIESVDLAPFTAEGYHPSINRDE